LERGEKIVIQDPIYLPIFDTSISKSFDNKRCIAKLRGNSSLLESVHSDLSEAG
jgi:hypothetical protein